MGKRKGRKETLISTHRSGENDEEGEEVVGGGKGPRFFACYLLTSLSPRFKGHTYIGFTVNPRRRIRQHNGEIGSGAWRTKRKRPWEMVVCIYGFPTNVAALQFEWAWQHPVESLAVRSAAASFKSLSGIANKIKLAYTMLSLPAWNSLNLSVNFFSTKYKKHTSGCPTLPQQMRTHVCLMDELPCYNGNNGCVNDELGDDEDNLTDILQESTEESIEAGRKAIDSPSSHLSSEEIIQERINKEDISLGCRACSEENWIGSLKNSQPIREEDQRQPFILDDDSPYVKASSSFGTSSYHTVSSYVEEKQIPISVEDFTVDLNKKQLTPTLVAGKDQVLIKSPCIPRKVEVIDIFTPSPCYTINSGSKKRRPVAYPEVIDLTYSPMFV